MTANKSFFFIFAIFGIIAISALSRPSADQPEAAALATLSDMRGRKYVKATDSFVVVDCGGGTVDIISYSVQVWEHGIKLQFDGRERTWSVKMPFECLSKSTFTTSGAHPKVSLTSKEVQDAFDPTVNKIYDMIMQQITAYVILVGGFGRCKYLLGNLKERLGSGTEVLQSRGAQPWTAICHGAVIHASSMKGLSKLSVEVQNRISCASYGILQNERWDEDKHQKWMARNQIFWFIKEGDITKVKKPMRHTLYEHFEPDQAEVKLNEAIYRSTKSRPSKRKD
ncbi:hypothetical protein B0T22DRAFT_439875 [Podospora appendiculata]|uniref:DJ-1/PfpI domain-containing protein n=1 Tax=Podospora appendiculata TaxID=314037 RepID=A0AAE1CCB2_9PEZI|nr:hypothetical protein B0T22DRAFT_439875 [Podospora appendiculata]